MFAKPIRTAAALLTAASFAVACGKEAAKESERQTAATTCSATMRAPLWGKERWEIYLAGPICASSFNRKWNALCREAVDCQTAQVRAKSLSVDEADAVLAGDGRSQTGGAGIGGPGNGGLNGAPGDFSGGTGSTGGGSDGGNQDVTGPHGASSSPSTGHVNEGQFAEPFQGDNRGENGGNIGPSTTGGGSGGNGGNQDVTGPHGVSSSPSTGHVNEGQFAEPFQGDDDDGFDGGEGNGEGTQGVSCSISVLARTDGYRVSWSGPSGQVCSWKFRGSTVGAIACNSAAPVTWTYSQAKLGDVVELFFNGVRCAVRSVPAPQTR